MDKRDAIRRRPGMYVGDTHDGSGLAHLVWEVVANSIDEHLAGHCSRIDVEIRHDGSVRVDDNGRGIRVDDFRGIPFAQYALTHVHETPTLDGHAPHEHVGKRGLGLFPVNALCAWLVLETSRGGVRYIQRFERGVAMGPMQRLDDVATSGTSMRFKPDPEIFSSTWIDAGVIARRLRELSFLLPRLTLRFRDLREHVFHEPRGLASYVKAKAGIGSPAAFPPFELRTSVDDILVDVAATWSSPYSSSIESFANVEKTTDGGTHVRGLVLGLVDGWRSAVPKRSTGKRKHAEEAIMRGLVAVVCVRLNDPSYEGPTKAVLSTPRVRAAVRAAVREGFARFLAREPRLLAHLRESMGSGR